MHPTPAASLEERERRAARQVALDLLRGVGAGETREEWKAVAFHARRSLSPAEMAAIDPEWMALPAIDVG